MPGASRQHCLWASLLFWFLFHVCYLAGHQWSWNSNYLRMLVPRRLRNSFPSSKGGAVYKPGLQTAVFASVWKCGRKVRSVVRSTGYSCQRHRFSSQLCGSNSQRALGNLTPAPCLHGRCMHVVPRWDMPTKNICAAENKMLIGYCLHRLEETPKQKRGQLVTLPSPNWSP